MRIFGAVVCLWVAVIAIAISIGGNVFQMVVIDPVWSASPPESVHAFFAATPFPARLERFHTNPLGLIALVCLVASPLLAWNLPDLRKWLLWAIAIQVVITVGTVLYVWPINKVLFEQGGGQIDASIVTAMTRRWLLADRTRLGLRLASFVCLLRALMLSGLRR